MICNITMRYLCFNKIWCLFGLLKVGTQVNVTGTLVLFQVAYPLMKNNNQSSKFVTISSAAGSIADGAAMPLRMVAYGASKAALNYLTRRLHFEHEDLGKKI